MISFTGSTARGRRVSEAAAGTVKRVALELGGKSAERHPRGRRPSAGDHRWRIEVLPELRPDLQRAHAHARPATPAGRGRADRGRGRRALQARRPLRAGTTLGPLVSGTQREQVRDYIRKGSEEGAKLVTGGVEPPEGLERGYFVRPTVFSEVTPEMTIAQEEIFGPVLAIIPYEDENDAVRIANNTVYGLAGGVWSGDRSTPARGSRGAFAPDRSRSMAAPSTRSLRSAATSSPATDASSGVSGSRSSSRSSHCSSSASGSLR